MQEEKYLEIINNYGVREQAKHFMSECVELFETILEYELEEYIYDEKKEKRLINNIENEIADVLNFIEQFILYYKLSRGNIKETQLFKNDRTLYEIKNDIKKEDRKK